MWQLAKPCNCHWKQLVTQTLSQQLLAPDNNLGSSIGTLHLSRNPVVIRHLQGPLDRWVAVCKLRAVMVAFQQNNVA